MQADLFLGLCLAMAISLPAWRFRALDASGALAALLLGTIVFGFGGMAPSVALIAFFLSSSIFSALPGKLEMPTGDESRGRSWKQVAANGIIPTVAVLAGRVVPHVSSAMTTIAVGSIAAAAADSWGTELGTRYGGPARDIVSRAPVQPGASGGVSLAGLYASVAGAIFIGSTLWISSRASSIVDVIAVMIGGICGAIADSIIGSTLQARFICASCHRYIELPEHCGERTTLVKGKAWIKNNVVNFAAAATGAIISLFVLDIAS